MSCCSACAQGRACSGSKKPRNNPSFDYDGDEGQPPCPMCNGPLGVLGALGNVTHYSCRNCGWETNSREMEHREKRAAAMTVRKPRKNPSKRPSSKLDGGTKSQIAWIMGNVHVGVPDEEVIADWNRRCAKAGLTPALSRAVVKHALSVHHKNIGLYNDVMGGRIGSGRRKR